MVQCVDPVKGLYGCEFSSIYIVWELQRPEVANSCGPLQSLLCFFAVLCGPLWCLVIPLTQYLGIFVSHCLHELFCLKNTSIVGYFNPMLLGSIRKLSQSMWSPSVLTIT